MSDQTEAELERTRKVVAETIAAQSAANEEAIAADTPDEELPDDVEADDEIETGWAAYTVVELQEELRNRELPVSGSKDELVARLDESDAAG